MDFHYVSYDPDEVWNEMMLAYVQAGGDILYPGDEKEIFLRAVQAIAEAIMARVDNALRMDTLSYATGEYLKEYGLKRGCAYIEAVPATVPVEMTFVATGSAQTIPAGTGLTADGSVIYLTTQDLNLTGSAQTISTTLSCQTAGEVGNGLREGVYLQFVQSVNGFISCLATAQASGGTDAEEEEAYRERIRAYGLSASTTGSAQSYESAAMAVSSQIIDARALNEGGGQVGVYLILSDSADSAAIIAAVTQALSAQTSRPLTDDVNVALAEDVEYTLNVQVQYSSYSDIADAINEAVDEYKAWQDNSIGRAFNPDKLMAMLYQAGCERVQFAEGSGMGPDPESAVYTEIDPDQRCKGTITLTVVNT